MIYALRCPDCGTPGEIFCHVPADLGAETRLCACGGTLNPALSVGRGLTCFEEGRPFVAHYMDDQPVTITSHRQFERELKARGLTWASERTVKGTGGWI
jgi:hypothetical protein